MIKRHLVLVTVPVEFQSAEGAAVFEEYQAYEVPYFGEGLEILDIGANIGTFALWANLRWPGSRIRCFEPHPGTFELLRQNIGALTNVNCVNAAVSAQPMRLCARYPGDSEAALSDYAALLLENAGDASTIEVSTQHPAGLPAADILKIDTEGAEYDILKEMNLAPVSLILLDYHTRAHRDAILALLETDFAIVREQQTPWAPLLKYRRYNQRLRDDVHGSICLVRKGQSRLRRNDEEPHRPPLGLRVISRQLPRTLAAAVLGRLGFHR